MFRDKLNFKLLNLLILLVIIYIIVSTSNWWGSIIGKVISIIFPFVVSFAIAYAFYPLVKKLQNKGVRKTLAVTLVITVTTALFLGLIIITVPIVYDQLLTLSKLVAKVLQDLSTKFSLDLGGFENSITNILNDIITSLGTYISNGTIDFVGKSVNFFTKFIIIYIVSIYFLASMDKIRRNTKDI